MAVEELGGNIILSDFNLDKQEMIVAKKMAGKYAEKIRHFTPYQELKLEMKKHQRERRKFEIRALLTFDGGKAIADEEGDNAFVILDEVLKKILAEVEHKIRKK